MQPPWSEAPPSGVQPRLRPLHRRTDCTIIDLPNDQRTVDSSRRRPLSAARAAPAYRRDRRGATAVSRVIGLTGGIGSGKSVVAGLLAERGAVVVDADTAAHHVYRARTEGWRQILAAFGRDILHHDGSISRKKLAAIVFHDAEARNKLNAIVHPHVRRLLSDRIASLQRQETNVVVAEVPLLIEAIRSEPEWARMFDQIWVVTAPEAQVIKRVRARGRMSESMVRAVIDAQLIPEQRLPYADVVIDNSGSLERLRDQVETLWQKRCAISPR